MKIRKTLFKKPDALPSALETIVYHLIHDDLDQISKWANLDSWSFPKGDFLQYIDVLNRFDTILNSVCEMHELNDSIQKKPFNNDTKEMVLAILNFSRLLYENCKNRSLYNSYEHLNSLLNTTDIDILRAVLQLLMKESLRLNTSRTVQPNFKISQDKIRGLISGGSISELISKNYITNNKITMSFYREDQDCNESLKVIDAEIIPNKYTDHELFWQLADEHMPKIYHFELLNRIRMINHATERSVREQLLIIRFLLITIIVHTMPETIAQNKIFIYEPHLVSQLVQLITYDNDISIDIQTYALYTLRGIAMHRAKITEVLTAFNASANHGILLHILRQLSQFNTNYTMEFLDAFFILIKYLLQSPVGSAMFMSAGITTTLVEVINHSGNMDSIYTKSLVKVIRLLDTIINNISSSFSSFLSVNGLDSLLKAVQVRVDYCIEQHSLYNKLPDIDSIQVIKEILRFLIRIREYENTSEGLRNLIETSLPNILKNIMENYKTFDPKTYALAFTVMSTFIHNEPTSLTVLQELGLPQVFLKTFLLYDESSIEVLTAGIHAFGAICLNSSGLEMFHEIDPLPHFFQLLTSKSFVKSINDMGSMSVLGTTMDELIRHHPSLKTRAFECTNKLLLQVIEMGNSEEGKPSDNSHKLTFERKLEESPQEENVECLLLAYINLASEFLDGFFKNTGNVNEFIKYKGPDLLLQYYTLPSLPYNFFTSNAFHALNNLFRTIANSSPQLLANQLIKKIYDLSRFLFTDLDINSSRICTYIEENGKDEESVDKANNLFYKFKSLFGYVGLLSTVFSSPIMKFNNHAGLLVEWSIKSYEEYDSIIEFLGELHRTMMWQNILLRESSPKFWYSRSAQTQSSSKEDIDLKDPRTINTNRFKTVISEVSPALLPILLGIIKASTSRLATKSPELFYMRCKGVAHKIAKLFNASLCYLNRPNMPNCKYNYYASLFSMISMVLLGPRSRTALQVPIAIAFEGLGNIDLLVNTFLPQFWKAMETEIEIDEKNESLIQRINTCIEIILSILYQLGSTKLFNKSNHVHMLISPYPDEKNNLNTYPLNYKYWLSFMSLKLSSLNDYLRSPVLNKISRQVLHSLLRCVTQSLEYERPYISIKIDPRYIAENNGSSPQIGRQEPVPESTNNEGSDHDQQEDTIGNKDNDIIEDENNNVLSWKDISRYEEKLSVKDNSREFIDVLNRLDKAHNLIRTDTPLILAHLVDVRDDLDLEIRDLMITLCCGDTRNQLINMEQTVQCFFADVCTDQGTSQLFESSMSRIRILALMLCEPSMQSITTKMIAYLSTIFDWFTFLDLTISQSTFSNSKWFTILSLILEICLVLSDEPPEKSLFDSYKTSNNINNNNDMALQTSITGLFEKKEELLKTCIHLLKSEHLTEDNLIATLRMIVCLTKSDHLVKSFLEMDGLEALFTRPSTSFTSFEVQRAYIIMILRHIIESKPVLIKTMRECIKSFWYNSVTSSYIDIIQFLTSNCNLIHRDYQQFLKASSQLLGLSDHRTKSPDQVYLRDPMYRNEIAEAAMHDDHYNSSSTFVIQFLLEKVLSALDNENQSNIWMAYTGFLLQCIFELILSYPSCKSDIIKFDTFIHFDNIDTLSDSLICKSFLYRLIDKLLPYNTINNTSDLERRKHGISIWVVSLMVGLCYDIKIYDKVKSHNKDRQDKTQQKIRNYVLRVIRLFFKETLESTTTRSIVTKYTRYYVFAELCNHLLSSRVELMTPVLNIKPEDVTNMAMLMLNQNYISLMISAINDIDVDFPYAKTILTSVMTPLEQLTKINLRNTHHRTTSFEKALTNDKTDVRNEEEPQDMYISMDTSEDDNVSEEEVNNLYRNSSLAMFDGTVHEDEDSSEEEYEDDDDDVEMASSGEEVIEFSSDDQGRYGTDTDMEDEESVKEDDEVEVEDEEMEELIRSHRYHHSDTEEDDNLEDDEDDDETDSHSSDESSDFSSSDSYTSSNESLDSNRSDSIYSEEEMNREITWPLDEVIEESEYPSESEHTEEESDSSSGSSDTGMDFEIEEISDSSYDDESDDLELNAEELENVEDNLRLFFNENPLNTTHPPIINSATNSIRSFVSHDDSEYDSPFDEDNIILHPLLRNTNANPEIEFLSDATTGHLQAYEDIIGGGAAHLLEQLFLDFQRQEHAPHSTRQEQTNSLSNDDKDNKETLMILKEFTPMTTANRWAQEAKMMYTPSTLTTKAVKMKYMLETALLKDTIKMEDDTKEETNTNADSIRKFKQNDSLMNESSATHTQFGLPGEYEEEANTSEPLVCTNADQFTPDPSLTHIGEATRIINEHYSQALSPGVTLTRRFMDIPESPSTMDMTDFDSEGDRLAPSPPVNDLFTVDHITNRFDMNVLEKETPHSEAPRIVDLFQLASLVRLLFVPHSISKTMLNRLLLNLCKNTETRKDLLSLLLYILQVGCKDLVSVDDILKQLFFYQKGKDRELKLTTPVKNIPNLIAQRCLEILYYVVAWNSKALGYFFTKKDIVAHLRYSDSANALKTKAKHEVKYPILNLIHLLSRSEFLDNANLMEQLINLIATISRSIPTIVERYETKYNHTFKPPAIPNQYLEMIADILSFGECSSFTFQYTISVLSHMSALDGALKLIINRLILKAKDCSQHICIDLKQLSHHLNNIKGSIELLDGVAVTQFSATTSYQARLLRVLKAIDYLYTRKQRRQPSKQEENQKAILEVYNELDFLPMWEMLSSCLTMIQEREDLMNAASILLPLVESFMSVSRYTVKRGYTTIKEQETGDSIHDFFAIFTERHKKVLNIMIRNNPTLMNGSFSILTYNLKILDFDNKRNCFIQQLRKFDGPRTHSTIRLSVSRERVFEDTYEQLHPFSGKEIRNSKIAVEFMNEDGIDEGGVSREWFSVLARQMFDPNYALFIASAADRLTYQPNRASGVSAEHLNYFKFVGRIIGKAIHDGRLLDAYFTRSFYKLILGRSVDYRDVETVDPTYYKSLVWMLENDITDIIDATFSIEVDDFGKRKIIDLKANGRNIAVTEANKHEYVALVTEQKLVLAIKDQVNAFLEGFYDIIPVELIQIFNEQELELLISGLPDIDIDDWKANTVYVGYTSASPQIHWFWRAVRSFTQEERAKLLQFTTGTSKVPLEGFSQLQGSNGVQKFQIHKEFGDVNRLPSAHTCFNQIDLPQYVTYEDLRSSLFKAMNECSTGFALQ
ncbi:uncharacterized protein BX663DRAFT_554130 [Cokeromyces recurvatus]|uniref:uncharacterized protein n=1 Tax=Cokeromyces recurvatus TaxID=90255 RepID=UPI00222111A2|nr:uncharacterized protein BX663DRAFT_554130 [Cokeromyces recurvatus]KAI7900225.1 hypothetical protein BX663DRAFT_554130 [Cokeromyces recurvatus]